MIFLSSALRWTSGGFRRSRPLRYRRSKATRTMLVDLPLNSFRQDGEVRRAVGSRNYDLAVDDRRSGLDVPSIVGGLFEAMGPVMSAAGKDLDRFVRQTVAVELDFVNPAGARRHLFDRGGQGRFDEAGERRLDADRRRFSTLKRHLPNSNATDWRIQTWTEGSRCISTPL
jgi:hypothetical protein